jgi:hypothetical protein
MLEVVKANYAKSPLSDKFPKGLYHCVAGSGYHQGMGSGQYPEADLTENMLGGTYHGPIWIRKFKNSKRVFVVFHGQGGAFMYPETQAGRELFSLAEAEALGIYETHVDCVICGHLHNAPLHLEKYGQHFIRVGCWKIWDGSRFGFNPIGKKQPKCSAGILLVDVEDRIRYIQFDLKPMPKLLDVVQEQ